MSRQETTRSRSPNAQLEDAAGMKTRSTGSFHASTPIPPIRQASVLRMSIVRNVVGRPPKVARVNRRGRLCWHHEGHLRDNGMLLVSCVGWIE